MPVLRGDGEVNRLRTAGERSDQSVNADLAVNDMDRD
jgi:hypothetical protein